jgi:AcrR family transcriptional regulator
MRVTAAAKEATRERILDAALELFRRQGFEATTTRDIAQAAEIATGTLFNYFDTKESLLASLAGEALAKAHAAFSRQAVEGDLTEALFALAAAELRQLKPLRKFLRPLLETSLSPLAAARQPAADETLRIEHLELVEKLARRHGLPELSPVALHVYWSLYVGVLAFWSNDKSPRQEDTLALLDESLAMLTAWLNNQEKPYRKIQSEI